MFMNPTEAFKELADAKAYVAMVHAEHGPKLGRKAGKLVKLCRDNLRSAFPLHRPTLRGKLGRREDLARAINAVAVDGEVGIIHGGRDCDGAESYQGDVFPACAMIVEEFVDRTEAWAEGHWGWELCPPAEAREHGFVHIRSQWEG